MSWITWIASIAALIAAPLASLFLVSLVVAVAFGVPASRVDASGLRVMSWAVFGNDEGGLYGERDNWSYLPGNSDKTVWTQVRWWSRNPLHNLFWHVLDWPSDEAIVLVDVPPARMFYKREPAQWINDTNHFQLTIVPPFIGWRLSPLEGYFGWRDNDGRLGLALRTTG